MRRAGFTEVTVVSDQFEPDGSFPTVKSPNPEEGGTLELALSLSTELRADLVLANDPDADRLAVAVPTAAGRFIALTGNEIGALLADFLLERAPPTPTPLVVTTNVSSPLLAAIGNARGARVELTATGFKWLWSAALELERTEPVRFLFGCEEAIGFSVCGAVRDKDGISAALVFAELAAQCRAAGESVLERLRRLYVAHGVWASTQHGIERPGGEGAREIADAIARLVAAPPASLIGEPVTAVVDFRHGASERPLLAAGVGARAPRARPERACARPSERHRAEAEDLCRSVRPGARVDRTPSMRRSKNSADEPRRRPWRVSRHLGFD